MFGTKASAAAEAVLDNAFLDKPFFWVFPNWTHQQLLSSSRVPPDSRPAGLELRQRDIACGTTSPLGHAASSTTTTLMVLDDMLELQG